eukprot:TRINITY_DN2824_c0_g1_i10.p1 TRINITY_DN2824_c0_g1~~TRINITY_DN2824_c0_g1_i10.p1  ORF type:complete len:198 (-),score=67.25 TRINITY_DN2824_c0_g1_i10:664-1233(-)
MPRQPGPVTKECDGCDKQIPVACKTCPHCSQEFRPEKEKRSEDFLPEVMEDQPFEAGERRRSVRAKRDKPDYYDAMEYESKRQKTPRSEKKKVGLPTKLETGKVKRFPAAAESQGRATLNWQKGGESGKKKGKKSQPAAKIIYKDDLEDMAEPVLEDIPPDKMFNCAVSLAEINRKLGLVMWKPEKKPT